MEGSPTTTVMMKEQQHHHHPSDDMVSINFEESGYLDGGISYSHRRMEKLPRWQAIALDHCRGEEIRIGGEKYFSTLSKSATAQGGFVVGGRGCGIVCARTWWDTFQAAFGSFLTDDDSPRWTKYSNPKEPCWILKITAEYGTLGGALLVDTSEIQFPSKECAERYSEKWNEEVRRGRESMEYVVELFQRRGGEDGVSGEEAMIDAMGGSRVRQLQEQQVENNVWEDGEGEQGKRKLRRSGSQQNEVDKVGEEAAAGPSGAGVNQVVKQGRRESTRSYPRQLQQPSKQGREEAIDDKVMGKRKLRNSVRLR